MFIGEGPGAEEDKQGEPFCGPAGKLLMKMAAAIGYKRGEIYLDNTVKCRPENNRKPTAVEAKTCVQHVLQQIPLVNPRVVVLVGNVAVEYVTGISAPMRVMHGTWHEVAGYPTSVIYHPAYLLRLQNPELQKKKMETWEDLLAIKARIEAVKLSEIAAP